MRRRPRDRATGVAAWAALVLATALVPTAVRGQGTASAAAPVRYDITFDGRVHHEARVRVTFAGLPDGPLDVVMPTSSPGRYALHGFAKNVYDVTAATGDGARLDVRRADIARWQVTGHHGTVVFAYTVFGDHAGGTFPGIDESHAHLNMPAVFAFAPSLADRPIRVRFGIPEGSGWKVATQLVPGDDPAVFTAPDLDYFMDSPTELSAFQETSWTVGPAGAEQTIRMTVHHQGTQADVARFAALARPVMEEEAAVFGGYPRFDHGTYTFIADYMPWDFGDGMEHRNSTILVSTRPLAGDGAIRNLSTLAHEFFHAWNMERLRAASIEPFDYTGPNMASELWFGEGFTSYYDGLAMVRAGIRSVDDWAADLTGFLNATINSPARRHGGPAAMSRQSVYVDAAAWVDETNQANTFLSYYTYGSALAAGLDLTLRTRFHTSLDAYMRLAWRRYGLTEIPYDLRDLEHLLGRVTGDTAFAADFFRRSINGSALPDYEALLARAGFVLRHRNPDAAVLGVTVDAADNGGARVSRRVLEGSPAYDAGLGLGDRLLSVDGRRIRRPGDLDRVLARKAPGDRVTLRFLRRGREVEAAATLVQDPSLEVVPFEVAGRPLTPEARRLRAAWIGSKAGGAGALGAPGDGAAGRAPAGEVHRSEASGPGWELRRPPVNAEFRGLDVATDGAGTQAVWAVGRGGVWAMSSNGGDRWRTGVIPGADSLFLVGVHATDALRAQVLATHFDGGLARIYRTADGGETWATSFEDHRPGAFYDGMAFWDVDRGVAFGDAVDGRMTIVRTDDGEHWQYAVDVPPALPGEGGFAASGRAIAVAGTRHAWIGTGVGEHARVLRSEDGGRHWTAVETPLPAGPTSGIFAVAFRDTLHGVAVGGDYRDTTATAMNVIRTDDGGRTWTLVSAAAPPGVRYGVAWAESPAGRALIAVGPSGTGWSTDDGATWTEVDPVGYNTVAFDGGVGWAAGVRGLMARWRWQNPVRD